MLIPKVCFGAHTPIPLNVNVTVVIGPLQTASVFSESTDEVLMRRRRTCDHLTAVLL